MRVLGLLFSATTCIAGEFINLTFDDPDLSGPLSPVYPGGPGLGNTAALLRGWTVLADDQVVRQMTYSQYPLGSGGGVASLLANSPAEAQTVFGANTLTLRSPGFTSTDGPVIRLRQTGTVPADATGLWFFAAGTPMQMYINGERIIDPRIGSLADPVIDVSRYAGQNIDLEFLLPKRGSTRFDIFGFTQVPEPSTWALGGVGVAALLFVSRRKH